MALAPRTRLGPYEIVSLAGAGGMGEVYRARDTRLGRTVAIKVIGSAFGNHPEMRQRFQQEAQFVAQLDHPHIAALYDVGHDAGVDYLVMEFLEGKSLASRIARGPVPFGELVGYAIEIAAALAYAHTRGVVHRDLKPANILITYSGIKIIDFGLGKLRQPDHAPSSATAAMKTTPMPPPVTEQGVIPGTAAYMSPERLQGLEADSRSDIFAFGAILYEMATGRRPFDAPSSAALIADILMRDPQPIESDRPLMGDVDWIVQRCLKKNPDERWQSAADIEAMLKRVASSAHRRDATDGKAPQRIRIRRLMIGAAVALMLITALAVATWVSSVRAAATAPLIAVTIPPPPGGGFTPTDSSVPSPQFSVSPDGSAVAFVAAGADGVPQLWLRRIDSPDARPLPGTADATYPFWAATGRSIAFFADGALKRLDIDGGAARSLAPAPHGRGGAWSADDVILFAPDVATPVFRVNADGTVAQQTTLATTAQAETSHRWPQFLPDGKHFIYFAHSTGETQSGIYRGSLDRSPPTLIVRTDYGGVYARPGHLLYVADDVLVATPFDETTGRISGSPVRIVDGIATSSNFYGAFSASTNGVLAYATKAFAAELVWMGRDGKRLSVVGPRSGYVDFRLSPDGRYLAVAEVDPHSGRPDLRLADIVRGTNVRLTTSPADDASPVWSPDGTRIVFRSNRESVLDLYMRSANAGGADELFLKTPLAKSPTDWSRAGNFIVYQVVDDATRYDIWAAPIAPPHTPRPLVRTPFDEMQGQISPDGRWLAYTSNQSSRLEVYVQPLGSDTRWQVSVDGGSDPRWRADGKELFYLARDGRLMAVDVTTHPSFDAGPPRGLFRISDAAVIPPYTSAYDVDASGQRFLVRMPLESLQTQPLTVFVNWSPLPRTSH